jgi:hypothetical protein
MLSRADMQRLDVLVKSLVPGDQIRVTFQNKWTDDSRGQLYFVLAMATNGAVNLGVGPFLTLKAVADSGRWAGCFRYVFTVGAAFDADYFAKYTIWRDMVTNIEKL